MNSFYGGKQGRTYHIVERYDSVADMVTAFKDGGSYTVVNYGQYVIIDTIKNLNHRSDLENGLLFRRGFNYNEAIRTKPDSEDPAYYDSNNIFNKQQYQADWAQWVSNVGAGAEYVGQIVGPQGESPEVIPVEWDDISKVAGKYIVNGSASKGKQIDPTTQQVTYNDNIKVASVTLKDSDGNITGANIAFDIPIPVFDFSVSRVSPYTNPGIEEVPQIITEGDDVIQRYHNFYHNYHLTVPEGKKGDSITNITISSDKSTLRFHVENYDNLQPSTTLYDFSFKTIDTITQNIRTRHYYQPVIGSNPGKAQPEIGDIYKISSANEKYAICIENTNSSEAGNYSMPEISSSIEAGSVVTSNNVSWYIMEIDSAIKSLNINYTTHDSTSITSRFIDYIYSDAYGNLYVVYSTDSDGEYVKGHKIGSFNSIKSVTSKNNKITISYIRGNSQVFYVPAFDNLLDPQKFYFGEGAQKVPLSNSINYPVDIQRIGDNLAVLYLDPQLRKTIGQNGTEGIDYYILPYEDIAHGITYNGTNDYGDTINDSLKNGLVYKILAATTGGYHIFGKVQLTDLVLTNDLEKDGALSLGIEKYLQNMGSPYAERAGWVVTVSTTVDSQTIKTIYAFDYDLKSKNSESDKTHFYTIDVNGTSRKTFWYPVQDINMKMLDPVHAYTVSAESSAGKPAGDSDLYENGLWFVVTDGHDGH